MHGWRGKILHINLSDTTSRIEEPSAALYEKFIGGKGLAGYYLSRSIRLSWDDPGMPLLFFTGPLVDTPSPTSGRMAIVSRSPLTGTVGDTSVGGKYGTQIKRAGLDGIVITGRSAGWRGIVIRDGAVEYRDAAHLQGKTVSETLREIGDDGSAAVIGPAAENGVLFASIMIDGHYSSGRGGLGLVMAAKKLKYIAVSGSGKTSIHDRALLDRAREEIIRLTSASPALLGELGISNFGTGALLDLIQSRRMLPTDNFRATAFADAQSVNAFSYKTKYHTKKTGCAGCHVLCKKKGERGEIIPEYETMSHFTALLGNTDLDAVVEANRICNEAGMDTISAAATIACHSEITGAALTPRDIVSLLGEIAASRGVGAELARGSWRYAESKGHPGVSISVKKLELPAYDPRGARGMALAYAVSTRGGCHLRAYPISHEILRKPVATDRFTFSGKARIIKIAEDLNAVIDSLTACKFLFFAATLEEFALAFQGVTGVPATAQDLLRAGERIYYHDRVMNAQNGFTAADDDLPARFFTIDGTGGNGIAVPAIDRAAFLKARADYYKIRGLDKRGLPTNAKMKELGMA
ncbi:MAG TPA: aldehyde ferredoxin oxidoreductase family protein [Spirochaetota bacterium]|nr:aldehyde ferredoxin oxidoreductase family protein [Spirochaetota bacterium]